MCLQDTLKYKENIFIVYISTLKQRILEDHLSFHKSYEKSKCSLFWESIKIDNQNFMAACDINQRCKGEMVKSPREQ